MKYFNILILTLVSFGVLASANMNVLPSLDWQKSELESKIYGKIDRGLSVVVEDGVYYVDVEIQTSTPDTPKFHIPLGQTNESAEQQALNEKKKELEELQEEVKKKKKKSSEPAIKFTNDLPDADYGDSVVFSKFGMEAPLIDDFNDFSPDGKIVLTMGGNSKEKIKQIKEEFNEKKDQLNNKIKKLEEKVKGKPSVVEQMWKYNNSIDIFKNITAVSIYIRLPQSLSKDMRVKIEKLVKSMKLGLGSVKPKFNFEYNIDAPKAKDSVSKSDLLGAFSGISNIIAIILGVLLIGVVGNKLISKFFELNSASQAGGNFTMTNEANDQDDDKDDESEALGAGGGAGASADSITGVQSLNGIERFKFYIENTPKEAILLLKKWISVNDKSSKAALRALVQQVDNVSLKDVFTKLSEAEKVAWRDLLDKPLTAPELALANDFISNQIVQSVIVPSMIEDPETYDLMLQINASTINEMYSEEPNTVALILNALNNNFVAEVLSQCNDDIVEDILMKSIAVKEEDVREGQESIKGLLSKYVESKDVKPFVEKIFDILPNVNSTVERSIFETLKEHISFEMYREICTKNYPAELIKDLPTAFLKETLAGYNLKDKVQMLLGQSEEDRAFYLDIFAPDGTKARDLMTIEFDTIEKDESEMNKVIAAKEESWKAFVIYTRKQIAKDTNFKIEIEEIINTWAQSKYDNISSGPELAAVA